MKRIAGFLVLATLLLSGAALAHRQEISGNLGIFYSSLSPYGEWVNADVGFAWRPLHVNHQWRPYLHGRWAWTDYGWYWVSNEPFGWATFHYGRWTYDDYYGWIWIPDRVWGPAWVEWRYDDDYIGWAPLTPYAQFSMNAGIVWSNHWVAPVHYWNFLSCRRFTTARVSDYVEPVERTRRIFGHTRGVVDIRSDRNRVINGGIDARFVERRANIRIPRVDVVDRNEANTERFVNDDRNMRIEAYRPRIDDRTRDERPGTVERRNDGRNPAVTDPTQREMRGGGRVDPQTPRRGVEDRAIQQDQRQPREQERRLQELRDARQQERSLQQQQRRERPDAQQDRSFQQQQRRERPDAQQDRSFQQQRRERPDAQQERSMRQEQRPAKEQERPSINRGSQQSGRERSPGRTPPQQGEQRARGRRPA
jgi:hypothetical protein